MEFQLFVLASFALLIGVLLAIGKWYPGTGAEQLDWKPTRSYEQEVQLELDDIDQMLELQNERRRRTGRPEISEEDIRSEVELAERDRRARAEHYRGANGAADPDAEQS